MSAPPCAERPEYIAKEKIMRKELKKQIRELIPAFKKIIELGWNESYENDRDLANDWSQSEPFDRIIQSKSKSITAQGIMKLIFETIYLADENGSNFDIQDVECKDEKESISELFRVFISEAVLYVIRRNEIETSELTESEVAGRIIEILN